MVELAKRRRQSCGGRAERTRGMVVLGHLRCDAMTAELCFDVDKPELTICGPELGKLECGDGRCCIFLGVWFRGIEVKLRDL